MTAECYPWDSVAMGDRVAMRDKATADSEAVLIRRIVEGEPDDFERLVRGYLPRLFAMARRYSRQEVEAQDLVQEILIKAHQKLPGFRGEAPFEHWLMRLAVRTCYDQLRSRQRCRESTLSELGEEAASHIERTWTDESNSEPGERQEAFGKVVELLLSRLSPSARVVLTLQELEGKSVKEIAELTGWSVPLVKVRAFRARAEMRKLLRQVDMTKYL